MRFLLKNNGVLFENEMLQIGVKCEYKKNLGKGCYILSCMLLGCVVFM